MGEINNRKIKVLKDGLWVVVKGLDIKAGDIFRMFELNGMVVKDQQENSIFKAIKDTIVREDGVWSIECDAEYSFV